MKNIVYIKSILDMNVELVKRRTLYIKAKAIGESVIIVPIIKITKDNSLEHLNKVVEMVNTSITAKAISMPKTTISSSKYKAKII